MFSKINERQWPPRLQSRARVLLPKEWRQSQHGFKGLFE
jgi:hypothetical protein